MKILITSIVDLKKTPHNRLHQFVKHLSQNHEVTVLSINDRWKAGQTDFTLYTHGFEDIFHNVSIEYFSQREISPVYQELASIATLGDILRRIHYQQFDVHLNYSSLISGYLVSRKMKSVGIDTIYDIADDLPAMIRSSPQIPALLRVAGEFLGKIAFRRNVAIARRITIITEQLRNSFGIPSSKTVAIPNGVDMELFNNYPSTELKRKLGLNQAFVVGYVGVLREWLNLEPIFSVVRSFESDEPNIKVLIVGEEGALNENKTLAQRYGISHRVIFAGTVAYAQVPGYISCMDVCLIPFKSDAVSQNALPLKLFEYMACEKPVVSTRLNGVMEAVQDRVLYASNSEDLKQKIMELYKNEKLRTTMGAEGRQFVKQNYSWRRICLKLEEVLSEVAKDKR